MKLFRSLSSTSGTSTDSKSYTKSSSAGAFLPDDTSVSMSIMESPVRPINKNGTRTNQLINISSSCPSPSTSRHELDKITEYSLDTWSKDDLSSCDHPSAMQQKLTSTMKLPEPMDSVAAGMTFEPRLCSSRLLMTSTHDGSHVNASSETGIVGNCESASTMSVGDKLQYYQQQQQDENMNDGLHNKAAISDCNTADMLKEYRKDCVSGIPPKAPQNFGFRPKAPIGVEMNGVNSDSGFNTYSISSFEPTDMDIIEER